MPNHWHSNKIPFAAKGLCLSLATTALLANLLSEASHASPTYTQPLTAESTVNLPLLADNRSKTWQSHNQAYSGKPRHQYRERHQEPARDSSKGQTRARYQEPARGQSRGPQHERYRQPPRDKSKGPHRDRYQTTPPDKPKRHVRERQQEPVRHITKSRERHGDDYRRYDRDRYARWRVHEGYRRPYKPYYYAPSIPRGRHYAGPPRHRHSHEIVIVQPFRYAYPRHHGHYYLHDSGIWGWLSFTAITLAILDNLNAQQQREHELALYSATNAPLGETIYWHQGNASGSVTPIQDGTSSAGRYCREFQHEVEIGGSRESLYGTACQNPDGSWEIVQ